MNKPEHVYVFVDSTPGQGIVAASVPAEGGGFHHMPMVCLGAKMRDMMKTQAAQIAKLSGRTILMYRYQAPALVDQFEPPPKGEK